MRIVLGFLLLLAILSAKAQEKVSVVNLTEPTFNEFEIFGDSLDKYTVYFTGENHQYATFNTQFQFKLLKYLYQTQGVRHFVFEQGPGLAYLINQIICEDKTTHLHFLRELFAPPFYEWIKNLKAFNENKSVADKIVVDGIDIERFPVFSVYALNQLVDTLDKKVKGGQVFEQIEALASSKFKSANPATFYAEPSENFNFQFGEVSAWQSLQSIIKTAYENEKSLKNALKKDSTTFFSIIKSLEVGQEWYITEKKGDVKSPIIRERFMAEEFERIYLSDSTSKYYGQFGRCHLHKDQNAGRCYDYYMNSIANRINEIDPRLENQVLVIPIFYNASRNFDKKVIESLNLDERYTDSKETYIIDLAYTNGDNSIVGFYNNLPFTIICNAPKDEIGQAYDWGESLQEVHLGVSQMHGYVRGLSKLDAGLVTNGANKFDRRIRGYAFAIDFFDMKERGASYNFSFFPEASNGDRFRLKGYHTSVGSSYPMGNKWILFAPGFDIGYGKITLIEEELNETPNLIQQNGKNIVVYKNDIFTIDPTLQFRITLPLISLNFKAGYAFDISNKYWKLDGKMKDFVKTSFTAPYIQVGASLNFKTL